MSLHKNIITNVDSYKSSHRVQYPPGTEYVYSYIMPRDGEYTHCVFFGLQMFVMDYLMHPFTAADIEEAEEIFTLRGEPFYREGWEYILNKHGGYLPIQIFALPEGTVVEDPYPVLAVVVNTDPKCAWVTSYVETALLRAIWYPTTVASKAFKCRREILAYHRITSDEDESAIDYKLHDFGARGVSSLESAAIGGLAHLTCFRGTDNVEAVRYGRAFYNEKIAGVSIPAAEHSTITAWGREYEYEAYKNMVRQFGRAGATFSVVSDSYDLMNAVEHLWGHKLRAEVINSGACAVIRPDSGDPMTMPIRVIDALSKSYGFKTNSKGYKVLNPSVRVIQGDGITDESLPRILDNLLFDGWSTDNLFFGMGGGLLQKLDRDTMSFAMKCSAVQVDGQWRDVYKEAPEKMSKRGRFAVIQRNGKYVTVPHDGNVAADELRLTFRNGELMVRTKLQEVRERVAKVQLQD
jgi:nicotinamide phosphoribosyltransferase